MNWKRFRRKRSNKSRAFYGSSSGMKGLYEMYTLQYQYCNCTIPFSKKQRRQGGEARISVNGTVNKSLSVMEGNKRRRGLARRGEASGGEASGGEDQCEWNGQQAIVCYGRE
jgi:hypothetical protein